MAVLTSRWKRFIHDHPEYQPLFTVEERETARRRLEEYKYPPVIDPVEQFIGAFASDVPDWTMQPDKYLGQALMDDHRAKSDPGG